jgi:hypothetical protein
MIRMARLLLISIPLVAALALLMLSPARFYNTPERYCLRLNDSLLDPLSGAILGTGLPTPVNSPSPNGLFDIVRKFGIDGNSNTVFLIDHTRDDEVLMGQNAKYIYWSANSSYYAFTWSDDPYMGPIKLTVGSVTDGKQQRTVVETSGEDTTIQLRGLSADGRYVALTLTRTGDSEVVFYSTADLTRISVPIGTDNISMFKWSQTGHQVGLIERSAMKPTMAHVLSPDMSWHVVQEIVGYDAFTNFMWSPDTNYVAIEHKIRYRPWTHIISRDGLLTEFAGSLTSSGWAADSRTLMLWHPTNEDKRSYDLLRFDVTTQQSEILIPNVYDTHALSPDGKLLIAPIWEDEKTELLALTLFHLDIGTSHVITQLYPTPVFEGIRTYWPPLGHAVSLTRIITDFKNNTTTMSDIWINTETLDTKTSAAYSNITSPMWTSDGSSFIQWWRLDEQYQVSWFDAQTYQEKLLTTGMENVDLIRMDDHTGDFYYRWQDENGQSGVDLIAVDGTRLAHWIARGSAIPVDEGSYPPVMSLSPDNRQIVINSSVEDIVITQFFRTNGEAVEWEALGPAWMPLSSWSPDGAMFAYVSFDANETSVVSVMDGSGRQISQFDQFRNLMMFGRMYWVACEE